MLNEAKIAELERKLASRGARMTKQRFVVLEVLGLHPGHTTADRILAEVQRSRPKVNKTTIYRTLEWLARMGLVGMTDMGGGQYEYELLETPHHHLICKECGAMIELPDSTLNPLRQVIEGEHGFRPCFDHFALFGVCQVCQSREPFA